MHVLVHSGRYFNDSHYLHKMLDSLHREYGIDQLTACGNTLANANLWCLKNSVQQSKLKVNEPDYYLFLRDTPFDFICEAIKKKKPFRIAEGDNLYNAKIKEEQERGKD